MMVSKQSCSMQVFDGHGGSQAADFASSHMAGYLAEQQAFPSDISAALVRAD
jgi:serine/threonine protein phosphatase PrpC